MKAGSPQKEGLLLSDLSVFLTSPLLSLLVEGSEIELDALGENLNLDELDPPELLLGSEPRRRELLPSGESGLKPEFCRFPMINFKAILPAETISVLACLNCTQQNKLVNGCNGYFQLVSLDRATQHCLLST